MSTRRLHPYDTAPVRFVSASQEASSPSSSPHTAPAGDQRTASQSVRQSRPLGEVSPLDLLLMSDELLSESEYDECRRFANQVRHEN